jgi:hypothetical protein
MFLSTTYQRGECRAYVIGIQTQTQLFFFLFFMFSLTFLSFLLSIKKYWFSSSRDRAPSGSISGPVQIRV